MSKIRFVPKKVGPHFDLSAEEARVVGQELLRLGAKPDKRGIPEGRSAKQLVEDARSKKSLLHPYIFGKTDEVVLQAAREELARNLIHSIRIELVSPSGEKENISLMVNVSPSQGREKTYIATPDAQLSEYMTEQRCEDAVHRLNQWLDEFRAFRHAKELKKLWNGVRSLLVAEDKVFDQVAREARRSANRNARNPKKGKDLS